MSYVQAIVIGILQGVTELFPVSSLGHSVLVPGWLGWDKLVGGEAANESFYLAFLVGLHLATGVALIIHYRKDWIELTRAFVRSASRRTIEGPTERMAWMLIVATIPVGVVGLVFEHSLRTLFAKPLSAAIFLTINGVLLYAGERLRRRQAMDEAREEVVVGQQGSVDTARRVGRSLEQLTFRDALVIGAAEILALFAGISRSGVTMVAGLRRGLDHEHAARFSFMLATPVILAAGIYKLPDLLGPNGDGVRGQIIVGSLVAGISAYAAIRFLERFFRANTLNPFALYCFVFGALSIVRFA
jgi:undecaprenyl-diphosphatase